MVVDADDIFSSKDLKVFESLMSPSFLETAVPKVLNADVVFWPAVASPLFVLLYLYYIQLIWGLSKDKLTRVWFEPTTSGLSYRRSTNRAIRVLYVHRVSLPEWLKSIDFKFSWLSHWSVGSSPGHDTCFPRVWYSNVNTSLHPGVSVYLWEQEMVFGIDVAWSATYLAAHAVLSTNWAI